VDRSVTWTESAADEFDAAASYRARASRVYASAFAQDVRTASHSLRQMAHRGRIVPELADETVREIFVKGHRLIYRIAEQRVWVLALIPGSRDFRLAWRERPRS
jgi:toxin ParE1/3/4